MGKYVSKDDRTTIPFFFFFKVCWLVYVISVAGGTPVPLTSSLLAGHLAKQLAVIIKGNVPSHVSRGIIAIGQFAKLLNHR